MFAGLDQMSSNVVSLEVCGKKVLEQKASFILGKAFAHVWEE